MERVNVRLRTMIDRLLEDEMNDIDEHSLILGMFMSSTMNAAIFLEKGQVVYLHSIRNAEEEPSAKIVRYVVKTDSSTRRNLRNVRNYVGYFVHVIGCPW